MKQIKLYFLFIICFTINCKAQTPEEIELQAKLYYNDFILPTQKLNYDNIEKTGNFELDSINKHQQELYNTKDKKQTQFSNSAELALENYIKLWELKPEKRNIYYYIIQQLGCYLKRDVKQYQLPESNSYFPSNEFTNLKKNWKCDFSINYLFEIETSKKIGLNLELQLQDLEEPNLYTTNGEDEEIYRFTWLRTFHQPISIRIEFKNEECFLYWKIGEGQGGYKPKGIYKKGTKKLSKEEIETFKILMKEENFYNYRNYQNIIIGDGAIWNFEQKLEGSFKSKLTHKPDTNLYRLCMYMLGLAKIKIPEKEIY